MASNRSNLKSRSAAPQARGATPRYALAAIARDGARIQIAAIGAAGKAVAVWTQAADRFTETVGDELLHRIDGETDSRELIVRLISATNVHLRELAALPSAATDHFDALLAHASINN